MLLNNNIISRQTNAFLLRKNGFSCCLEPPDFYGRTCEDRWWRILIWFQNASNLAAAFLQANYQLATSKLSIATRLTGS